MTRFTVFTLNMWRDNVCLLERVATLDTVLMHIKPDYIALQEVTSNILVLLRKCQFFSLYTNSFDTLLYYNGNCNTVKYRCVLFSKRKGQYRQLSYSNATNRELLYHIGENVIVATTHLQSGSNNESAILRSEQIYASTNLLHNEVVSYKLKGAVLMGDFNYMNGYDFYKVPFLWEDAWKGDYGYTFDNTSNPYALMTSKIFPLQSRLDRIYLLGINVKYIEVVQALISDHYGLYSILQL
jgi:endonuclease/exonuclease/phosphatase family metal-dependent hydrolase